MGQEIQRWHHSLSTPSVYLKTYSMESILIQLKTRNKQMKVEAKVIMGYQKIFSTAFIQRFNLIKNQHRMQRTRIISFNDYKYYSTQNAKNKRFFSQGSQVIFNTGCKEQEYFLSMITMIFVRNEEKISRKIISSNSDYIYIS